MRGIPSVVRVQVFNTSGLLKEQDLKIQSSGTNTGTLANLAATQATETIVSWPEFRGASSVRLGGHTVSLGGVANGHRFERLLQGMKTALQVR